MRIVSGLAGGIVGNLWNAVLMLAVTPVFVKQLGVEAFGLVSLIAVLQVAVGALDMGLGSTITREVARAKQDESDSVRRLLATLGAVYWFMAALIGGGLLWGANALLNMLGASKSMPAHDVLQAIQLIVVYLAVRWPVAFYGGVLSGQQCVGLLNALKSGCLTLRWMGGAIMAWVSHDLMMVLGWFVFTALFELVAMMWAAKRVYAGLTFRPRFELEAFKGVWRFSASMYAISLLAMLLTQMDRFAVSSYLGLDSLGLYSISYSLAAGTTLLQTALNVVALPAYSSSSGEQSRESLLRRYGKFSQVTGWVMAPVLAGLVLFAKPVVTVWIDAATAAQTAVPIALLAAGFCFNAVYSNTYLLGIASGQPGFFLWANVLGLLIYVIALVIGLTYFGIAGAAGAWFVLNAYYLLVVMPAAHSRFGLGKVVSWLVRNFGIFALAALTAFWISETLTSGFSAIWQSLAGLSLGMLLYLAPSYLCLEPTVRSDIHMALARFRRERKA